MRNIKAIGLIQRLNSLNKNSILSKTAVCSSNSAIPSSFQTCNYGSKGQYNHQYESSFNQSAKIVSSLVGAALFGTLAYQYNSKKNVLYAKESESISQRIEDFLESTKKEAEEVKEIADDVKAAVDDVIEIGEDMNKIAAGIEQTADHAAKVAEEIGDKVIALVESAALELEGEIDAAIQKVLHENSGRVEVDDKFLPDVPSHVQYLIVGGGTAANAAFKAIRAKDANAKVLVVTEEEYKPYMRPPLSKDLWLTDEQELVKDKKFKQYNGKERSIFFLEDEFFVAPRDLNQQENGGVAVLTGKRVVSVNSEKKTVKLDDSWEIGYDKCLIATGGRPKTAEAFKKSPEKFQNKVTLFRNISDFEKLLEVSKQGKHIAIVGGGFLGSELAFALAHASKKNGGKVTQVFPEGGNLQKILPEYLTKWTTKKIVEEGVTIVPNVRINGAQINGDKVELQFEPTSKSEKQPQCSWLMADHVVVAVGLEPNTELAINSGFETHPELGGFVVNTELQARTDVWVAGDAACFYDVKLGRRRVEHHDHAVVSGRLAGENMCGAAKPYWHQSMFWSDIGPKIGFEAIGLIDSSLQTVGLFAKADESDTPAAQAQSESSEAQSKSVSKPTGEHEYGKGVVLYLKNDVVVGALMWNVFKKVPIARQLIQNQEKVTDFREMAKLFEINQD